MRCTTCKQELPESDFYDNSTMSSGKMSVCKECTKAEYKARPTRAAREVQFIDTLLRGWGRVVR